MSKNDHVLPGDLVCLPASDPLLCLPEEKAEREALNAVQQLLHIQELVEMGAKHVREWQIRELQSLAIRDIYPCDGAYVTATKTVTLQGGGATHEPPGPHLVPNLVRDAVEEINRRLHDGKPGGALRAAAYALWRLNWIHAFPGGNGRTAERLPTSFCA